MKVRTECLFPGKGIEDMAVYMNGNRRIIRIALLLCLLLLLSGCAKWTKNNLTDTGALTAKSDNSFLTVPKLAGEMAEPFLSELDEQRPKEEFAMVKAYIPDIIVDLKYAGNDNFTGKIIYDFSDAYLRYGTIQKLKHVQEEVSQYGYSLKIWDAFRPVSAQFKLWEICPIPKYVANPYGGYSSHSKGNTVDITLVGKDGSYIELPTGFDDFSEKADRDYSDCTEEAAMHAQYLEDVMQKNGFVPYSGEWWHFEDSQEYPVEELFHP